MKRLWMVIVAIAVAAPTTALAQDEGKVGFRGWGPRMGLTVDPDQFHLGAHLDFGNFARHVRFQPSFEIGFGDDMTVGALNLDAAYRFSENWDVWTPYVGGGPGVTFYGTDDGLADDETDTEIGLNVIGGIERGLSNGDRFFTEARLGVTSDSPDLKLSVGWTFF